MPTMLQYELYFKRYGVRLPTQLITPRLFPLTSVNLPRGSLLHYLPESQAELGPASDDLLLANVTRLIFVGHVIELTSHKGNPRSTFIQPGPLINDYRRRYRKLRPLQRLEIADREEQNLIVANYALLPRLYKYVRSFFSAYFTWYNIQATLIDTLNGYLGLSSRQHFIQLNLPKVLPGVTELRKAELRQTRETLTPFSTNESLTFLDLWTWLGPNRENSLLGKIKPEGLDRVNIIFRHVNAWFTVNLGTLDSWRKDAQDEKSTGIDPKVFQLRVLRTLTTLHEAATVGGDDTHAKPEILEPHDGEDAGLPTPAEALPEPSDKELEDQLEELGEPMADEEVQDLEALDKVEPTENEEEYDEDGVLIVKDETAEDPLAVPPPVGAFNNRARTHTSAIEAKAEDLVARGLYSPGEQRRILKLAESFKNLPNPYGTGGSLAEALEIRPEDVILADPEPFPDAPEIVDKSMLQSTVANFDRQYVEKVLPKDILNSVMAVQQAGIAVTGYTVERVTDAVSDYEIHAVTLVPVVGRQSTIRFRVPVVSPEGTYVSNGVTYRLRKQRSDLPIRKVSATRVALSSYYSKVFVEKTDRATFNYDRWLSSQVVAKGTDPNDPDITNIRISNVADDTQKVPRIYSILSMRVASLSAAGIFFYFDFKNRFKEMFTEAEGALERAGLVLVGRKGTQPVLVGEDDVFYLVNGAEQEVLGRAEELFGLEAEKAPAPMAEIKIFAKSIPAGIVLSYLLGFNGLLEALGVTPRRVPNGQRMQLAPDEYALRFLDESLVFYKEDVRSSLILAGFNLYHATIRNYNVHAFDKKDIYLNVLESYGIGVRYLRELDLMNAMWVDPITREILMWMKEPTEYIPLLIRACEMLVTRHIPQRVETAEGIVDNMERARGYERFAGAVYSQMIQSIREYNRRTATSTSTITMKPHEVWQTIVQDPAATLLNQSNPIANVREQEMITYGGRGGRSRRSMVAETRLFRESDMGFISEATVDSGDVAIITYVPPNANFTTVRGTVRSYDDKKDGASTLISSAALLAPAADRDDPKRVNFINIQQAHGISAAGYRASPLRTGAEQVMAHRTDDIFAHSAKQDGEIIEKTDLSVKIQNADGTITAIQLGRRFGSNAGMTLPHEIVSEFKVGDKVKKGDIVAYNAGFFEPVHGRDRQVAWKAGVIAKVALMEAGYTLEDSSAISQRLSEQLGTRITKIKTVLVKFDQSVRNLVKVGDETDLDTILCTIEDAVTARADLFDEESIKTLSLISAMTPKAKSVGVVEKVEVFYHGDPEDMSESLQVLVDQADRERKREAKRLNKPAVTGSVDQSLRIEGDGLDLNMVAIRLYITSKVTAGIGDKAVFANQMKTVFGHVMEGIHETESGVELDAIFGYKSIQDRIVLSPMIIGTTNTLLRVIGEMAADLYFEDA